MSDAFTIGRMTWLDQVHANENVTPAAFRVAYAVTKGFNRERFGETGKLQSWRSQVEIAAETGLTRRGVQKCLDALTEAGHLSVEVGGKARGDRSTYEALVYDAKDEERVNGGSPYKPEKSEPQFAHSDELRANGETLRANGEAIKGEPRFAHKSLNQISDKISEGEYSPPPPSEEKKKPAREASGESHPHPEASPPRRKDPPRRLESPPDGFEEFWAAYPRHVGKLAAAKAFQRAVRGGAAPEEITAGASRFAAERLQEPDPERREKFTPHAATWLNAGRWNDAPAPAPNVFGGQPQRRRPSMFELALRGRVTP